MRKTWMIIGIITLFFIFGQSLIPGHLSAEQSGFYPKIPSRFSFIWHPDGTFFVICPRSKNGPCGGIFHFGIIMDLLHC